MTESLSFLLRFILKALGGEHPIRLSVGAAVGVLVKILADAVAASFPESAFLKVISGYELQWFLIFCCPLMFIPVVFGRRNAPEAVVHTINTIQALLDRAKLSKFNEQMFWRALLDKYVAAAKPDLSVAPDMDKVFDEASKEVPISNDQAPS